MSFLNRFIKNERKSVRQNIENRDANRLYFHEDLYGQVELLPRDNFSELEDENRRIRDFAENHSDGFGFTDIYVRESQRTKTSDRQIPIADFEKVLLECGFQKYSNVYSINGSQEGLCRNTLGFKLDSSVVYCDFEQGLIKNIWLDNFRFSYSSDRKEQLINGLFLMGEKWDLILNDWDLAETFDLKSKTEIERYIREE